MNERTKPAPLETPYGDQKFNKELKQLKAKSTSKLDYSAVAEVKQYEEKKYNLLTTSQKKAFDKFKKQFLMVVFKPLFKYSFSEVAELFIRTTKLKAQLPAHVKPELDIAGVSQKALNSKLAFVALSLLDKDNFILDTFKKIEKKRATLKTQGKSYEGPSIQDVLKQL